MRQRGAQRAQVAARHRRGVTPEPKREHHHRRIVLRRQAHQRRARGERRDDGRAAPLQLGTTSAAWVDVVCAHEEQGVAGAAQLLREGEEAQVAAHLEVRRVVVHDHHAALEPHRAARRARRRALLRSRASAASATTAAATAQQRAVFGGGVCGGGGVGGVPAPVTALRGGEARSAALGGRGRGAGRERAPFQSDLTRHRTAARRLSGEVAGDVGRLRVRGARPLLEPAAADDLAGAAPPREGVTVLGGSAGAAAGAAGGRGDHLDRRRVEAHAAQQRALARPAIDAARREQGQGRAATTRGVAGCGLGSGGAHLVPQPEAGGERGGSCCGDGGGGGVGGGGGGGNGGGGGSGGYGGGGGGGDGAGGGVGGCGGRLVEVRREVGNAMLVGEEYGERQQRQATGGGEGQVVGERGRWWSR